MEIRNYILILFALLIAGCSDDENPQIQGTGLNGTWTLTNVICFCGFPDPPGFDQTQLTIDTANGQIQVVQSGTELDYFRPEGTYTFVGTDNTITLADGTAYTYTIDGNTLQLVFVDEPQIADDEITFVLMRN